MTGYAAPRALPHRSVDRWHALSPRGRAHACHPTEPVAPLWQFARYAVFMADASEKIDLPPPAILKPVELWTGKQLFSLMLRPNKSSALSVYLEQVLLRCLASRQRLARSPIAHDALAYVLRSHAVPCGRHALRFA